MREDKGRAIVDIWGRTEDGNRAHLLLSGVPPYFYVDREPLPDPLISGVTREGLSLYNEQLYKITTRMPNDVPEVRKRYPIHYEADVHYVDRVRYDCGIKSVIEIPDNEKYLSDSGFSIYPSQITSADSLIEPRYFNIDIETSDEHGFADPKYPTGAVLSYSIYDSKTETVHACITREVDKSKVTKMIGSGKWLKKHIRTDKKVEPWKGKTKIYCVKDEYRLFLQMVKIFSKLRPDLIIGWNAPNYDTPYLRERSGMHSKRIVNQKKFNHRYPCPDFREHAQLDLMEKYKALYKAKKGELESKKLEFCATTELGYGKLKHDGKFIELYNKNPEKFLAYNIWDTIIAERINKKCNVLYYYSTLSEQAGTAIENTDYFSLLIDSLILHRLNKVVVLPSKSIITDPIPIEGAYTHTPSTGSLEWVVVIDFKQQYPGAIRSNNMSPETVADESYKGPVFIAPSGTRYKKSPRGLLPMILDECSANRDELKRRMNEYEIESPEYKALDAQQTSYKFFMNSFYGVMATKKKIFRLTDNIIGYDIPDIARHITKYTIKKLEKAGVEVVYGDTDSCLIRFPDVSDPKEVLRKTKKVIKWLNRSYDKFAANMGNSGEPHFFKIEAEKIYELYFQSGRYKQGKMVGKKRYAGLLAWKDGKWLFDKPKEERIVIKGYEVRRSNASYLTRELQKKVLQMILSGTTATDLREVIRRTIDNVRNEPGPELGFPTGVQKEEYSSKGKPIHVRAMEYSNEFLGYNFGYGDKPIWFYGYIKNKPRTDVFAIDWGDDLPKDAVIDIDKMIERCIKSPLEPILQGFGYSWSELIEGNKISKQEALF